MTSEKYQVHALVLITSVPISRIMVDVPPAPVVPTTRVLDTGTSGPQVWRWPPEWVVHCPSQTECIVADENPTFLAVTHLKSRDHYIC